MPVWMLRWPQRLSEALELTSLPLACTPQAQGPQGGGGEGGRRRGLVAPEPRASPWLFPPAAQSSCCSWSWDAGARRPGHFLHLPPTQLVTLLSLGLFLLSCKGGQ